jgi:hypothetical protein
MWADFYQTSPDCHPGFFTIWGVGADYKAVCDFGVILRSAKEIIVICTTTR